MRNVFLLVFLIVYLNVTAQGKIDILHYKYEIELNDNNDTIYGKAEIKVKFDRPTKYINLDFVLQNNKGKGMIIDSISGPNVKNFTSYSDSLKINFPKPIFDDVVFYYIFYHGIPSDGLIISKNKYGHRTFFADNWPNRGHNWIPCVDDPADKASVEFIVTAPQHYQVVANGILVEETNLTNNKKLTHWKEDVSVATKVMVIGAAEFAVSLAGIVNDCIPVYSWVYPEDRDKGFYDFAQAMEILPFFIKNVGPYGYKKLANVQSKTTFGGLENASAIFYAENSVTGSREKENLLAHEIAHQWFGNMATEKSFAHLWLSEGFATYYSILYFEKKYGADTATYMLNEDRNQVIAFAKNNDHSVIDETKDYMELLNPNNYQKGSWVLHMLRRQMGDSVFHTSIKTYYAEYAGKNADTKDLQKVFEKTSGKDLSVFFQQWLYTAGIPTLDVSWNYLPNEKKVSVTVKQLQKTSFVFSLEFQLKNSNGNNTIKTIPVSKQEETFVISVKEKPASVILDPNTSLLFSGNAMEKK